MADHTTSDTQDATAAPDTPQATPAADPARDKAAEKAALDAAALGLPDPNATTDGQSVQDMKDMKLVVMDSAELATRAAGLAADAGINLRTAIKDLGQINKKQNKWTLILMGVVGFVMLGTSVMFAIMSMRIQARVAMLDDMLVAVGKRVTEMDASLELVGGAQETLKALMAKQGEMVAAQTKIDERLEQVLKSAQDVPEQTAKQVEARIQTLTKQMAALESRSQSQSSSSTRMASQLQAMQSALGEAAAMKRELELMARQQRERQAQENAQAAQAAAKSRERLVQYPRAQPDKP